MYRKIDTIIEQYKDKPGSLIPVPASPERLRLPPHAVQLYRQGMKMSPSVVFGVATTIPFYPVPL
jgi:hypothetical protein